jgi:hypothetical protein
MAAIASQPSGKRSQTLSRLPKPLGHSAFIFTQASEVFANGTGYCRQPSSMIRRNGLSKTIGPRDIPLVGDREADGCVAGVCDHL